jgi:hypothetical protein
MVKFCIGLIHPSNTQLLTFICGISKSLKRLIYYFIELLDRLALYNKILVNFSNKVRAVTSFYFSSSSLVLPLCIETSARPSKKSLFSGALL